MSGFPFIVAFSVLLAANAHAEAISKKPIGSYERAGEYWQKLKITATKAGEFRGEFEVATQGCQGDVVMTGKSLGAKIIRFSKKEEYLPGGICTIDVTFSSDFKSATVTHEYCGYSGAGCDFNGTIKRVRK